MKHLKTVFCAAMLAAALPAAATDTYYNNEVYFDEVIRAQEASLYGTWQAVIPENPQSSILSNTTVIRPDHTAVDITRISEQGQIFVLRQYSTWTFNPATQTYKQTVTGVEQSPPNGNSQLLSQFKSLTGLTETAKLKLYRDNLGNTHLTFEFQKPQGSITAHYIKQQ